MAALFTPMHYNNSTPMVGLLQREEEASVRTVYGQGLLCMAHCCSIAEPMAATEQRHCQYSLAHYHHCVMSCPHHTPLTCVRWSNAPLSHNCRRTAVALAIFSAAARSSSLQTSVKGCTVCTITLPDLPGPMTAIPPWSHDSAHHYMNAN